MAMDYFLGCPIWSCRAWQGSLFTRAARSADFLRQYASVFNTVEGNTTFYGVPGPDTVAKWRDATPAGFRFSFKFPKVISHDKDLHKAEAETDHFLNTLAPLGSRVGTFFLQLPPRFENLNALEGYLRKLPRDYSYAVEARAPAFHRNDALERHLQELLRELNMDRVAFDTRPLMELSTKDPALLDAKRRKPKAPPRIEALGAHPFLRYVGHPQLTPDTGELTRWAILAAGWIREGRTPYIFMHQAPDDERAPELCRIFHGLMRARLPSLPELPPWPGEQEPPEPQQLELF